MKTKQFEKNTKNMVIIHKPIGIKEKEIIFLEQDMH